jgi:hypothetical protein
MSKDNICVYPSQCQFPRCNCDQPHKAQKYHPNTGIWPYISPEKGGVAGLPVSDRDIAAQYGSSPISKPTVPSTDFASRYGVKGNPFDGRYKEFSTPLNNPPSGGPSETQDPKNRHGCDYLDCGCQAPCTTTNTVRERFVIYVGTLHKSRAEAEEHIKAVKANISKGDDSALWYVLSDDTTTVSRIVRV